jgi:predicted ATPase
VKRVVAMHLKRLTFFPEKYPTNTFYPFNKEIFSRTRCLRINSAVSFLVGENGTGKSTLLKAIAHKCQIHIWNDRERFSFEVNPYEDMLCRFMEVEWENGCVPGSFFSSELFHHFAQNLDEWAVSDPKMLEFFGGKSLNAQSHGQSLMSFFRARYQLRGLYLLDEPETALSPRNELGFVRLIRRMGEGGQARFIIATHSPILLACPGAQIFTFDEIVVKEVRYEETDHYRVYKAFMENPNEYL